MVVVIVFGLTAEGCICVCVFFKYSYVEWTDNKSHPSRGGPPQPRVHETKSETTLYTYFYAPRRGQEEKNTGRNFVIL